MYSISVIVDGAYWRTIEYDVHIHVQKSQPMRKQN